jgi:hypothetical protein
MSCSRIRNLFFLAVCFAACLVPESGIHSSLIYVLLHVLFLNQEFTLLWCMFCCVSCFWIRNSLFLAVCFAACLVPESGIYSSLMYVLLHVLFPNQELIHPWCMFCCVSCSWIRNLLFLDVCFAACFLPESGIHSSLMYVLLRVLYLNQEFTIPWCMFCCVSCSRIRNLFFLALCFAGCLVPESGIYSSLLYVLLHVLFLNQEFILPCCMFCCMSCSRIRNLFFLAVCFAACLVPESGIYSSFFCVLLRVSFLNQNSFSLPLCFASCLVPEY